MHISNLPVYGFKLSVKIHYKHVDYICCLFKKRVESQDIRNTKYKTVGKRVSKTLSEPIIRISELTGKDKAESESVNKGGVLYNYLNKLAYFKSAQNNDQHSDGDRQTDWSINALGY